jgi:glycosyltransferase involved in cell wall biosynthesis
MRLAVYCDYSYRLDRGALYAEVPFALFLDELGRHFDRLTVTGRFDPNPAPFPYRMTRAEFVPLPYYTSGAHLSAVLRTVPAGIRRFWRMLDSTDVVWVLGPNPPQALLFAILTKLRRRRLVLGVRQDLPRLIRHRYPGNRLLPALASILDTAFRALSLRTPIVVIGPGLAARYRRALRLHVGLVSLLPAERIATDGPVNRQGGDLTMLSVGRLDPEKNPLLLADILAAALETEPRWRLDICGDGPMRRQLEERLETLGVADRARLLGHVPINDGLWDMYENSDMLIHVSFTEGVPQVLLEAFASRLPVVATAVGGIPRFAEGCALLVPANDAPAAATALNRLVNDDALRRDLVQRGVAVAREHTIDAECSRLAAFLRSV